jgi:hypothetical protein
MKTMLKSLLALGLAAGISTATLSDAQAHRRGYGGYGVGAGVAAGIIGLGVLGAYSSRGYAYSRACYEKEFCNNVGRRCWENKYGETVCRGGEVVCRVRTVCP